MTYKQILDQKNLDYTATKIDYSRFPKIYNKIKSQIKIKAKTVQLIGTNGKGSTGRFVALLLKQANLKVAHFTSPHIFDSNERFWYDGSIQNEKQLNIASLELEKLTNINNLSYFEYCFLLFIVAFKECDFLVIETGLGGEYDATSVLKYDLQLITKIGIDHQNFLGDTLKEIASTKLNAIDTNAIVGIQDEREVYDIVSKYQKNIIYLKEHISMLDKQYNISDYIEKNNYSEFYKENISLALLCVEFFDIVTMLGDIWFDLPARMQKIQDNLYIDVGHNASAAKMIVQYFKNQKINIIYNTYSDKDYKYILQILKPIIHKLLIIQVDNSRIVKIDRLKTTCKTLGIDYDIFDKITDRKITHLVFGSFSVVEYFLKLGINV